MNRKLWICALALALLCGLAGCHKDQTDVPAATQPVAEDVEETTLPQETTQPEETIQLPEGEGVESIDEVTDGETNVPENQEETKPQNSTKPTEAPTQKPTEAPSAPDATEPTQSQPEQSTEPPATEAPTTPPAASTSCGCAYQQYMAMSAAEQEAYMNSFGSPLAFVEWIKQAQAEHEAHDTSIKVEGGDLDIGDYINP